MMKSTKRGKRTSNLEVTNISLHGFWLLIGNVEYFVGFHENPWFRDATIRQILDVRSITIATFIGPHWMSIWNWKHWKIRKSTHWSINKKYSTGR